MVSLRIAALLLVALVASASATKDPTDPSKCHVDWFRVVVEGKMVYAWNCICDADDGTPFVYGGAREDALDFKDTTAKQIHYAVGCFNHKYVTLGLDKICKEDPGKFMDVAQPALEECTKGSEDYDPSNKGPFEYSRDQCESMPSEARQVGLTQIAAVNICQCYQPQWRKAGAPAPYVLDGRAPFPVDVEASRPDTVDHIMHCMKSFQSKLAFLCKHYPKYYTETVRLGYAICCDKLNKYKPGSNLDCKAIVAMS